MIIGGFDPEVALQRYVCKHCGVEWSRVKDRYVACEGIRICLECNECSVSRSLFDEYYGDMRLLTMYEGVDAKDGVEAFLKVRDSHKHIERDDHEKFLNKYFGSKPDLIAKALAEYDL